MSEARLHAREKGDGSPVVVLLHGFGDTHGAWASVQDALAADACTIAFDLPGHGGSLGYPDSGRTKVAVGAVLAEMKMRGIGPAHLVGHSMGGAVAALAALENPAAVASLTLLAPGGFGTEINHRLLARYAAAHDADGLRSALENMYGWNRPVDEEDIRRLLAMRALPGQVDKLIDISRGLSRDGRQGVIARDRLGQLDIPVKVLWGMQDRVLPTRQSHRLPPRFATHIFENTGHMLINEVRDDVLALIRQNMR